MNVQSIAEKSRLPVIYFHDNYLLASFILYQFSHNFVKYFKFYIISAAINKEGKSQKCIKEKDIYGRILEILFIYFHIFTAKKVLVS